MFYVDTCRRDVEDVGGPLGTGIVLASIGASFGALYLLWYLYHQRTRSGARWFRGMSRPLPYSSIATYGGALLIFDPATRIALEAVAFTSLSFMGPFFLAFGLDYTGRGNLIRTPLFGIVAIVPLLAVIVVATDPAHLLSCGPIFRSHRCSGWQRLSTRSALGVFFSCFSVGTAAVL